jgi:hypothetical protein
MTTRALVLNLVILMALLSGCVSRTKQNQSAKTCPDLRQVVEAFYAANDASQSATSLRYLTDDVVLVNWAEGANGRHMSFQSAVGQEQVKDFIAKPGLKRTADQPDLPNYTMQEVQLSDNKVSFKLVPDRLHPDKRPYNPFAVEVFFLGCRIEILKVVERVTWL